MDYSGEKCPKCGKPFSSGDDIVVCPICGTPQHRECYDELGHCVNEEKHSDDFVWTKEENQNNDGSSNICKVCGSENADDALFCKRCGSPLENQDTTQGKNAADSDPAGNSTSTPFEFNQMPMGFGSGTFPQAFKLDEKEDMGGVTAGEVAKLVKVNTPYYLSIFKKLKTFGIGRFNFAGFLFTGGWYLYRKQYLKGAIISIIVAITMIVSGLYAGQSYEIFSDVSASVATNELSVNTYEIMQQIMQLPIEKQIIFYLPSIMSIINFGIMLFCGFSANRGYYSFCVKKIKSIKEKNHDSRKTKEEIEKFGGVDTKIALCMLVCYVILQMFPNFLR